MPLNQGERRVYQAHDRQILIGDISVAVEN